LEILANFLVLILGTPEWGQPWGYSRSDYRPEDFCQYILRWILDGNDKIAVCLVLFGLLIAAACLIPTPYRVIAHLQSDLDKCDLDCCVAKNKNRDLESQISSLEEQASNNAATSAESITTLQSQYAELEMEVRAEQRQESKMPSWHFARSPMQSRLQSSSRKKAVLSSQTNASNSSKKLIR
jgi:uncharacterized membrane protein